MKTRLGFAATAIGAGLALCNPVTGAIVVGAGLVSAARGLSQAADTPGYCPPPTRYQIVMVLSALANGFASLFFLGTNFCTVDCSITHAESFLASGLFFGAMMISIWQAVLDGESQQRTVIAAIQAEQDAWRAGIDTQPQSQPQLPVPVPRKRPQWALPEPSTVAISEDGGQSWFTVEQLSSDEVNK